MHDQDQGVVDLQLDTLTKSVRFAAGIAPKAATRVSLGVALAIEDSANDVAGELLGIKINQGVHSVFEGVGSIVASACNGVRSAVGRVRRPDVSVSDAPVAGAASEFVVQAASEVRDAWAAAGHVSIQIEEPGTVESPPVETIEVGTPIIESEEVNS